MGAKLRVVRRRIRSVQSTMKITRALELIAASRTGFSETPTYAHAKEIADALIAAYEAGEVDEIHGVFTDFISPVRQTAVARRFVPMVMEVVDRPERGPVAQYLFEPEPEALLNALLPRYVET